MARCDDCQANKVCDHNRFGFENCGNFIPADVAPRAEVAREIFGEIERVIGKKYNHYVFGNNDLDSIEQDAIINFSDDLADCFAALKKKYTERCPDCKHFVGRECFSGMTCDQYDDGSSETMQEQEAGTDDVVRCKECFYNKNDLCMMGENLGKENYDPNFFCGSGYREDGNGRDRRGGGDDL